MWRMRRGKSGGIGEDRQGESRTEESGEYRRGEEQIWRVRRKYGGKGNKKVGK